MKKVQFTWLTIESGTRLGSLSLLERSLFVFVKKVNSLLSSIQHKSKVNLNI